jgi:vancomycin resistance protein VanJ
MRKLSFWLWLGWFYVLFTSVWLSLRLLFFDRLWWVALLNYIAIYLFVPLPLLLAASFWQHRWRLLLGLSIPTVAFILLYGTLFLPALTNPPAGRDITVMSFNVLLGNLDHAPLVRAIRASKPDILGLQEFTPELAKPLMQDLAADYPYSTLALLDQEGVEAVGILSRFPIETESAFPLPGNRAGIRYPTKAEFIAPGDRIASSAVIQIDGQRIKVVSVDGVHNPTPGKPLNQWASVATQHYAQKAAEVQRLERELRGDGGPFLLLCDCNLADTSQAYAQLASFAKDSFREAGWGFGHTINVPVGMFFLPIGQRMDYIWHSPEFTALEASVGRDAGSSDHLPVIAKLRLKSTEANSSVPPVLSELRQGD